MWYHRRWSNAFVTSNNPAAAAFPLVLTHFTATAWDQTARSAGLFSVPYQFLGIHFFIQSEAQLCLRARRYTRAVAVNKPTARTPRGVPSGANLPISFINTARTSFGCILVLMALTKIFIRAQMSESGSKAKWRGWRSSEEYAFEKRKVSEVSLN